MRYTTKRTEIVTFFACALILSAHLAGAATYAIDTTAANLVRFESSMPLEFIAGETNDIRARVTCDPTSISSGYSGWFVVDLRTLKTGIALRDEHMRDRHLETHKYPYARFAIKYVQGVPDDLSSVDTAYTAAMEGNLTLHGRTLPVHAEGPILFDEISGKIAVTAKFSIRLADYHIQHPDALLTKLAKTLEIEVRATLAPVSQEKTEITNRP